MLGPVIIRNSLLLLHARVACLFQYGIASAARVHCGSNVGCWCVNRDVGEGDDDIEVCEHGGKFLDDGDVG